MFVEVTVVLARVEFPIFLFYEEERGCLGRVGRLNLPSGDVFFKKVLSGLLFIQGKRVYFANLQEKGVIKVNFMVIGMGRGTWLIASFEKN